MRKIFNLLLLQFETVFALKKYMIFMIIMGIILGFIEPEMITFTGGIFIMATCYSTAYYEENSKMNYLIYSLPIRPKDYILSRYLYIAFNTFLSIIISSALYKALIYLKIVNNNEMFPLWVLVLIMIGIGIFMMTILVPFELILGFEKGRIALVFLTVFPLVFSNNLIEYIPQINFSMMVIKIFVLLCIFTLILISYFITSNLYLKKDI
jgi:ABC-2 type transport system permease protein